MVKMSRFTGNSCRLITMIFLTGSYFFVELIVGHIAGSISLVADSFHMLSDVMALFVGLAAVRISRWPRSPKNSYGWQRAEVLGTLVNTVMLVTLCFTIVVKAIQRFIVPEKITKPELMVGVGAGGLFINIVGLVMFSGKGHHHGHSHLVDESQQGQLIANSDEEEHETSQEHEGIMMTPSQPRDTMTEQPSTRLGGGTAPRGDGVDETANMLKKKAKGGQMNMKAVFLHVMADALGSLIVLISALIIWKVPGDPDEEGKWKQYLDPALSLILVIVILCSAIPLLRRSGLMLLQSVPKEVKLREIKDKLETIDGINKVHDLHVWQLNSKCIIGTVHIRLLDIKEYVPISRKAKKVFHEFDIHCTTIQPEFSEHVGEEDPNTSGNNAPVMPANGGSCVLGCDPREQCSSDLCCPIKRVSSTHAASEGRPSPKVTRTTEKPSEIVERPQGDDIDNQEPPITDLDVV